MGFTLIELLISISILAILSVAGFSTYNQAQIVARDARRKQDLRSIANGLELYYQATKTYPSSGDSWISSNTTNMTPWNTFGTTLVPTYINTLPTDPKRNDGNPWLVNNYGYAYFSNTNSICGTWPAGSFYVLATQLENKNDPENIGNKQTKSCNNTLFTDSNWAPSTYVITAQ